MIGPDYYCPTCKHGLLDSQTIPGGMVRCPKCKTAVDLVPIPEGDVPMFAPKVVRLGLARIEAKVGTVTIARAPEDPKTRAARLKAEFWVPFWCVVANVREKRRGAGPDDDVVGTKHFTPGTKVWCWPIIWGDGGERLNVVGQHRGGGRLIQIVADTRDLEHWRVKQCWSPKVGAFIGSIWGGRADDGKKAAEDLWAGMQKRESSDGK